MDGNKHWSGRTFASYCNGPDGQYMREYLDMVLFCMGEILSAMTVRSYCAGWVSDTVSTNKRLVKEALESGKEAQITAKTGEVIWWVTHEEAVMLDAMHRIIGGWPDLNTGADSPSYVFVPDDDLDNKDQ